MDHEEQIWILQNQIHELKLQISISDNINYKIAYKELQDLEKQYRILSENERDR